MRKEKIDVQDEKRIVELLLSVCGDDSILMRYGLPITKMNRRVLGREKEIRKLLAALKRPEISNVVLLAEAGTGKSALVSELALQDHDRYYIEIDIAKMLTDVSDANVISGYLKAMADEVEQVVKQSGKEVVLFMDEIHQIRQISPVALEALKPVLANSGIRGIRVIMATTLEEFDQHIADNQALTERMQRINLPEPDEDTVVMILEQFAKRYLDERVVESIDPLLYHRIYELSNRYIPANSQPRKSIDLLDAMIGLYRYDGSALTIEG